MGDTAPDVLATPEDPKLYRFLLFCAFVLATAVSAAALEAPKSNAVLTVTGAIAASNTPDGAAVFDRALLETLDWREIETHTSFTEGPQVFAGPTLASLLDVLEVTEGQLQATAVNDYSVTINVADAARHNVLLAMDHNGKAMRVRDKGPIWVVYPLPADAPNMQRFDNEMIWQLVRIHVLP